jgi:hypothetical protein
MAVDAIRADATVDPAEGARFSRLAGQWGPRARCGAVQVQSGVPFLAYIRDAACRR